MKSWKKYYIIIVVTFSAVYTLSPVYHPSRCNLTAPYREIICISLTFQQSRIVKRSIQIWLIEPKEKPGTMGCKLLIAANAVLHLYIIWIVLMAQEGEPVIFFWIGQANTPRLRARYWLQFALFNGIVGFLFFFGILSLLFFIPAGILAYQVSQK